MLAKRTRLKRKNKRLVREVRKKWKKNMMKKNKKRSVKITDVTNSNYYGVGKLEGKNGVKIYTC